MADGTSVAGIPWLNINPLSAVEFYQRGISQGQQAAQARNQAQIAAAEMAQRAAAQQAQQQQAQLNAQLNAMEFAQNLAMRKEANELKARNAALKYEALEGFRRAVSSGVPYEQALFQNPNLFLEDIPAIPSAIRAIEAGKQAEPYTYEQIMQRTHLLPDGSRVIQTGPNTFSVLQRPSDTRRMSDLDRKEYDAAQRSIIAIDKTLSSPDPMMSDTDLLDLRKRREDATRKIETISKRYRVPESQEEGLTFDVPPLAPEATNAPNGRPDQTVAAEEARMLIKKYPSKEQAIRARFRDTFGVDL